MLVDGGVKRLIDELHELVTARTAQGWDKYWRDCMRYALPQDVSYDQLLTGGSISTVTGSIATAPSALRAETKNLYDQTSLWAVERLTAGLLSLKTPEQSQWHGLEIDDPYGYEMTRLEEAWTDRVTRYLFKIRANPRTGFWPTHKAATRSMVAMGDGYMFIEEQFGDAKRPLRYEFVPLGECYRTVDYAGQTLRFYRYRNMTAEQIALRWPKTVSEKIRDAANDPKRRTQMFPIAHAIVPRDPTVAARGIGVHRAPWLGVYLDMDGEKAMDVTGYWEMPYIPHSWAPAAGRAYSEGPMALALAEIKSLNEMAKNELISSQQAVRPPLAVFNDNYTRINLNAGAINAGLINGNGQLLAQPIMTHTRPDFAQQVLETRRNNVREMLYLNLWQVLIQSPNMTATEALLRAQEKGDLLGPVAISFNNSLSAILDRELAILGRKGVFEPGSPLEAPESVIDKDIMPYFTAPLDRMRNMEEVIGAQRTVAGMMEVAAFDPKIMKKLDINAYSELLRKGNGAPAELFMSDEDVAAGEQQDQQLQQLAQMLELAKAGGDAAGAMGNGVQQIAGAAQTMAPPAPMQGAA